jgi:hypothetical protein
MTEEDLIFKAMLISSTIWDKEPPPQSMVGTNPVAVALFMALKHQQAMPPKDRYLSEEELWRALLVQDFPDWCNAHPEARILVVGRRLAL